MIECPARVPPESHTCRHWSSYHCFHKSYPAGSAPPTSPGTPAAALFSVAFCENPRSVQQGLQFSLSPACSQVLVAASLSAALFPLCEGRLGPPCRESPRCSSSMLRCFPVLPRARLSCIFGLPATAPAPAPRTDPGDGFLENRDPFFQHISYHTAWPYRCLIFVE